MNLVRNHLRWIELAPGLRRFTIVAACILLAWIIGRLVMNERFPLIVAGAAGLVGVMIVAFKLDWGVVLLLAATLFFKLGFETGTESTLSLTLVLTAALTGIWIVRMLIEDKRLHLRPSPVNRPLIAFAAVAIVSAIWSNLVRDPFVIVWDTFPKVQLGALGTMVLSPAAALLVANNLRTARHIKVFIGLFMAAAVAGLAHIYFHVDLSTLNTRGLFPLWAITLAAGQALFNKSLTKRARVGYGFIALSWFIYQIGEGVTWKSGWVPPLISGLVLATLYSRRLAIGLIVVVMIFVVARSDYLGSILEEENAESGVTRLAAWQQNWDITREHWLLGTGPAGYAVYYMSYIPDRAMATHSNYIDVISQVGVIGSAALVWMLATTGRAAWQLTHRVPRGGFEQGLAYSLLAGFVGLLVAMGLGDWFLPFAYTQGIAGYDYTVWSWMMIGLIMILHQSFTAATTSASNRDRDAIAHLA
ncbi:MAG TPA: O-antigen ligase family protein [Anaerolineae bacterium]